MAREADEAREAREPVVIRHIPQSELCKKNGAGNLLTERPDLRRRIRSP